MGVKYEVTWTTEVEDDEAASPVEAALHAWRMIRNPGSLACVFKVHVDSTEEPVVVDLLDVNGRDVRSLAEGRSA